MLSIILQFHLINNASDFGDLTVAEELPDFVFTEQEEYFVEFASDTKNEMDFYYNRFQVIQRTRFCDLDTNKRHSNVNQTRGIIGGGQVGKHPLIPHYRNKF